MNVKMSEHVQYVYMLKEQIHDRLMHFSVGACRFQCFSMARHHYFAKFAR
jgi:hypothetical protein